MFSYIFLILAVVAVIVILSMSLCVVSQFERGVVLTLGKFTRVAQPGLTIIVPFAQKMWRADIRITAQSIPPQDVITSDNVSVKVSAVAYYQVEDAEKALLGVNDYVQAIDQMAQITLRSTIGSHKLDELLAEQDKLNKALSAMIETRSSQWGIRVDHVEIRSVDLDQTMIRAMAQEAEAERGRRARRITAEGEYEAAAKLSEAAELLSKNPAALTLRTLSTLKEIGAEKNSVIIFPVAQETLLPPSSALSAAALANAVAARVGRGEDDAPETPTQG